MKAPLSSPEAVLREVDTALARHVPEAAPVAAFDADHTLWHADVGDLAWHTALSERRLRPEAGPPLASELRLAGAETAGDPHEDARRLYALYKQDRVSEMSILRAMTVCYAGWSEAELLELGARLARETLASARYEGVAAIARGLKERGLRVVVVSGSPSWLVVEGVRSFMPLDPARDVFGAQVTVEGGRLTGTMREPVTFFEGKVAALEPHLEGRRVAFAFGDSKGDVPLLESAARLAFAVHPRPALRALAEAGERFRLFLPPATVGGHAVRAPGTDRVIE